MIERRLEEVVPQQYRPQLEEKILPAFERAVLPKLPEVVRKRVGKRNPTSGDKAERLVRLRGLNESLKDVMEELESVKCKLDTLHQSDPRPTAAARATSIKSVIASVDFSMDGEEAVNGGDRRKSNKDSPR